MGSRPLHACARLIRKYGTTTTQTAAATPTRATTRGGAPFSQRRHNPQSKHDTHPDRGDREVDAIFSKVLEVVSRYVRLLH